MTNTYIKSTVQISLISNNINQLLSANKSVHAWQAGEYSHECDKLHSSYIQQHLHTHTHATSTQYKLCLYVHKQPVLDLRITCKWIVKMAQMWSNKH